jgi:nitroimidazol reductase NimA-like FMN-containing flavoprotein (pyridoxamine 5'-phosphate oxidase superfamily)
MENSKIPVMGHADGICHIYADKDADLEKALPVIVDAKTQYVAVCNAVETLLVHKDIAPALLPALKERFEQKKANLKGCPQVQEIIECENATDEDFRTEYLDYILSVKIVDSIDEAISHINRYGSHHTDCIITEDEAASEKFMSSVDSGGVYQNCSTRFADGFRYGFGAEVGVSTGKLHARGPVGLDGLVSYKYKLYGNGHIVADYSEGRKSFHFKDKSQYKMFREIRRKDRLTDKETGIALLERCDYGILSVLGDDDYPYGVPVNFAYKDNCIYIHGFLDGHKMDAIKNHPKVCFTAVGDTEILTDQISTNYISVVAFGKAEVIAPSDNDIRETAFAAIIDKYVPGEEERTAKYIKANENNTNAIKIDIEHLTCKQRNIR